MTSPRVTALLLVTGEEEPAQVRATLAAVTAQTRPPDRLLALLPRTASPESTAPAPQGVADLEELLGRDADPAEAEGGDEAQRAPDLSEVDEVLHVPGPLTPARAARAGLAALDRRKTDAEDAEAAGEDWIWFLPATSAPGALALEELLGAVARTPDVAIVGSKQLRVRREDERADLASIGDAPGRATEHPPSADTADGLVDVGLTLTHGARLLTGVEDGEIDQGQTDWRDDVMAVALPGMLAEARSLRRVGGIDPALETPWAEVDLGHRTWRAGHRVLVVPAARALATDRVPPRDPSRGTDSAVRDRAAFRRDRTGRILVRESLLPLPLGIGHLLLLPLFTLLRVAGAVIGHRPRRIVDEAAAATRAARLAPGVLRRAARASRTARVPRRQLAPLFLPRRQELRRGLEGLWTSLVADDDRSRRIRRTTWGIAGTRHGAEDADYGRHTVWTLILALGAIVLTLIGLRPILGSGPLSGPGLLPLPEDWRETWQAAWADWVPGGLGHAGPADPLIRLLGHLPVPGDLLVGGIVLLALPLSALTAWWAAGALTRAVGARLLLAVAWALSPPLLGALAAGRWPLLLVHSLLPVLALAVGRAIGLVHKRSQASVSAAAGAGLVLLVIGAVQPVLVLLVALVLALLAPAVPGRRLRLLWVLVPSLGLLIPYLPSFVGRPRLLLGVGAQGGDAAVLTGSSLLRLLPTSWSDLEPVIGHTGALIVPLVLPALLGLLALAAPFLAGAAGRAGRLGLVLAGVAGLLALLSLRTPLSVLSGSARTGTSWPGGLLSASLLGVLLAAACTCDALARREENVARPRRLLTAGIAGIAALVCLVTLAGWTAALPGMLRVTRDQDDAVPAAAADQGTSASRTRTLVLTEGAAGEGDEPVQARLVVDGGESALQHSAAVDARELATVRDGALVADPAQRRLLGTTAQLVGEGSTPDAEALRTLAVGYVVVPGTASDHPRLTTALDSSPLLEKVTQTETAGLWRVIDQEPRVAIRDGAADHLGESTGSAPASRLIEASGDVAAARGERTVVLSERYDGHWDATLGSQDLRPVRVDGWAQGFVVPAGAAGELEIHRQDPWRLPAQILLLVAVALTALVAVPWRGAAVRTGDAPRDGRRS